MVTVDKNTLALCNYYFVSSSLSASCPRTMRRLVFLHSAGQPHIVKYSKCHLSQVAFQPTYLSKRLFTLLSAYGNNLIFRVAGSISGVTEGHHSAVEYLPGQTTDNNHRQRVCDTASLRNIHTSAGKESLGADSTGLNDTPSRAKAEFEKWKASIDFDLLTDSHKIIHNAHMKAVEENREMYTDPISGFEVFTIMTHLLRGNCCGNVCRHCPYGYVNAPKEYTEHMRNNTAFYY